MTTTEHYTLNEVDQLAGSMLYIGRVHGALATLLDTTKYREDIALFEYVNHAPSDLVLDLLPTTTLLLEESKSRIEELLGAANAALDNAAELAKSDMPATDEELDAFGKIMHVEFGKKAKESGL